MQRINPFFKKSMSFSNELQGFKWIGDEPGDQPNPENDLTQGHVKSAHVIPGLHWYDFIMHVVLIAGLFAFAACVLFFTVVVQLEHLSIESNVNRVITQLTSDLSLIISGSDRDELSNAIDDQLEQIPNALTEADQSTTAHNNFITMIGFVSCAGMMIVCIGVVMALWWWLRYRAFKNYDKHQVEKNSDAYYPNLRTLWSDSAWILLFLIITELSFTCIFLTNYRYIDINVVRRAILDNMIQFANS